LGTGELGARGDGDWGLGRVFLPRRHPKGCGYRNEVRVRAASRRQGKADYEKSRF